MLGALEPVRVGGRRTTHGLADASIGNGTPPAPQQLDDTTLVLRLRSPGIFTDPQGRPRPEFGPEELTGGLGAPARVVRLWTRWQEIGGWHVASGLPKPSELAVCARSAFVIHAERAVALPAIEALARRGVGLRRNEGFGDLARPRSRCPRGPGRQAGQGKAPEEPDGHGRPVGRCPGPLG